MMLLKNIKDIALLVSAVDKCTGNVILRSIDGTEEFNLKSKLSQYIAIGKLCEEHGDEYEIFCSNKADEGYMLGFFVDLRA
jgi:hypothetical protein